MTGARRSLADALHASFRYWSLAPAVLLLACLTLYPMIDLVVMSVSTVTYRGGASAWAFTPLANVRSLVDDPSLARTLVNTVVFVIASVVAETALGLALALMVARLRRGKSVMRTVMIVPILAPPIAIGSMWKLMYNYDFGVFNQALGLVGLGPVSWLGSPSLALWSVVLVDVWHWVPFLFLILYAAVEALPREVLEAARVDGASGWQMLWRVTIPLLKPMLLVTFLFRAVLAFKAFDEVYLLTGGGPGDSSELLSLHLYKVFFEQNQVGYGALLSLCTIAGVLVALVAGRRLIARGSGP